MITIGVFAVAALIIFYMMNRSMRKRRTDHSERLERYRQYYEVLMERRKEPGADSDDQKKEE
jgi:hypothetical protein